MTSEGNELWGVKKTLKFVVPLTVVAGLIVYAYLPHDERLKVSAAKGGECIVVPEETVVRNLKKRDCNRTHDGEIFAAFDNYPAEPAADQPSPAENCLRLPEELTPAEAEVYQEAIDRLLVSGFELITIMNNEEGYERDVACVVKFPERTGSYLQELAATLPTLPPTTTTG